MKRLIGMSVAVLVVILQLAGFAAWRVEPRDLPRAQSTAPGSRTITRKPSAIPL